MTIDEKKVVEKISANEALERVNKRYARIGASFSIGTLYQKARRGELTTVKINGTIMFDPEEIDTVRFRIHNIKFLDPADRMRQIKSDWDLSKLRKKWGELLDTEGLIEAIEKVTQVKYAHATIARKRENRTLLCVGYQGRGNNKQYWYPAFQLDFINLSPATKEINPRLQRKREREELKEA